MRRFWQRKWAAHAGPQFSLALSQAVVWTALAVLWSLDAIQQGDPWRGGLAAATGLLASFWIATVCGSAVYRHREQRAAEEKAAGSSDGAS
jgi:hypothetical protein